MTFQGPKVLGVWFLMVGIQKVVGHSGPCLRDINACDSCGEVGHKVMDCPRNRNKGKEIRPQGANAVPLERGGRQDSARRHNWFYALQGRQGVEKVPDSSLV